MGRELQGLQVLVHAVVLFFLCPTPHCDLCRSQVFVGIQDLWIAALRIATAAFAGVEKCLLLRGLIVTTRGCWQHVRGLRDSGLACTSRQAGDGRIQEYCQSIGRFVSQLEAVVPHSQALCSLA